MAPLDHRTVVPRALVYFLVLPCAMSVIFFHRDLALWLYLCYYFLFVQDWVTLSSRGILISK